MNMRKYLWCFVLMAGFGVVPAAAAQLPAPDELARSVTEEVLAIVRADKDIHAGNQKKVLDLVETKVLPHFNFMRMTQLAMGKHWRQASPAQQTELAREFRALLVRTYTAAFTQYKNQSVEYRPLRLAPDDTDVMVKSLVQQPSGQPIAVDYSMEKTNQGWKVYNVKIEGISLVENYRNTFNSEVQKNGVDGLIRALNGKNKEQAAAK
ncbi:MAG: ABC transporter substrate-binding protein [Betaproteobacteria bacterium]|nr:ABC transporter substrate-binding protein [Betaproteobacteria bacterium]